MLSKFGSRRIARLVTLSVAISLTPSLGAASPAASARAPAQQPSTDNTSYQLHIDYLGRDAGWAPIPFERFKGLILVHASINGTPAILLFDNGFSHSVLDAHFAQRIGVKIRPIGVIFRSGTATTRGDIAEGVIIDIPHQIRLSTATGVMDLAAVNRQLGRPIDAILGGDALGHMAIGIFSKKSALGMRPSGAITPSPGVHSREFPLVNGDEVEATVNGQPARLQIDLGSDSMVTLSDTAWHRIFPDDSKSITGTSVRAEGVSLPTRRMPGNTLAFSGFSADGVVVDNSGGLPGSQDGLLGEGILSQVDFILDIPARKLTFMRDSETARTSKP